MKSLVLAVAFFGLIQSASAQDSLVQRWGTHFIYHPSDFFAGLRYEREKHHFQHHFLISAGVRTLFQSRFYPQIGYQFAYHVVKKSWLQAGPLIRTTVSLLHVNRNASHGFIYSEELFLGAYIGTGTQNHFRFSAGLGPATEQSWSPFKARFVSYFSWNYFGEISWSHAF